MRFLLLKSILCCAKPVNLNFIQAKYLASLKKIKDGSLQAFYLDRSGRRIKKNEKDLEIYFSNSCPAIAEILKTEK